MIVKSKVHTSDDSRVIFETDVHVPEGGEELLVEVPGNRTKGEALTLMLNIPPNYRYGLIIASLAIGYNHML